MQTCSGRTWVQGMCPWALWSGCSLSPSLCDQRRTVGEQKGVGRVWEWPGVSLRVEEPQEAVWKADPREVGKVSSAALYKYTNSTYIVSKNAVWSLEMVFTILQHSCCTWSAFVAVDVSCLTLWFGLFFLWAIFSLHGSLSVSCRGMYQMTSGETMPADHMTMIRGC